MKLGGKWLGTFSSLLWTWILWFLSNNVQKLKGFVIPKGMFIVFELKELAWFENIDIVVVGITRWYNNLVGKRYMSFSHDQIAQEMSSTYYLLVLLN